MPRLDEIGRKSSRFIEVPHLPWFNQALGGGLVPGAVYLLSGGPGLGKTTLINQTFGALANCGRKVLYISTEQGLGEFKTALERVHARGGTLPNSIVQNFYLDDSVDDIDSLTRFFARKVLPPGEEYHGVEVIAIDSVQGRGLSSNATKKFQSLFEFAAMARAQNIVTVLVAHITKAGTIAGPKSLEHAVDGILLVRRALRMRAFHIAKNRYGPDAHEPIMLVMDERGRLVKSPFDVVQFRSVRGFCGMGDELTETQASVSLPKYGCRPELLAPFLPEKRVRQLIAVLNTLPGMEMTDVSYHISCYLPRQRYREELDLPLAIALLASYLQRAVPPNTLFVGEIDLKGRVRSSEDGYLRNLAALILGPQIGKVGRIFIAKENVGRLSRFQVDKDGPRLGDAVQLTGVVDLADLVATLWPDLMGDPQSSCPSVV